MGSAAVAALTSCVGNGERALRAHASDGIRWRRQRPQQLVATASVRGRRRNYAVTAVAASCAGGGQRSAATVCQDSGGGGVRRCWAAAGGDGLL